MYCWSCSKVNVLMCWKNPKRVFLCLQLFDFIIMAAIVNLINRIADHDIHIQFKIKIIAFLHFILKKYSLCTF